MTRVVVDTDARREWLRLYLERFVLLPYSRRLCTMWAEVTVAAQASGRRRHERFRILESWPIARHSNIF